MDSRMLITYIIIDIFCIIIAYVIKNSFTTDFGGEQEVVMLKRSLSFYILFMLTGLVGLVVENVSLFYLQAIDYVANAASLICLALTGFYWFIYVQLRVNKNFISKKRRVFTYIPMILLLIVCASSPFTGWAFYINAENEYVRGPLFSFVSVVPLLYDVAASGTAYYRAFKEKQFSRRRQYFNLAEFIYIPFMASMLQIWLAGMPILAPAIATAYYIVFSNMQRDLIYNDALSGLNNRRRAMLYLEENINGTSDNNPLTVFMIDGNKFKLINDTYGHIEGDSAISCIAEAIQKICRMYDLFGARYGGDEFIMIKSGHCSFDRQKIGEEINTELREICRQKQKEYTLTVSVGNYTTTDCTESVQNVIGKADEALYLEKARRKKTVAENRGN